MRVHPAAAQGQQDAKALPHAQNLALAIPADAEDENGLEMADNVEGERAGAANDEKLREIVHARHDAARACRPEDVGGHDAEIGHGVEEGDKRDEQADANGGLVEEELRGGDGKVFNLLADPDLVKGSAAEGQGGDDDAKELGFGGFVDGEGDADAGGEDGGEHVARHVLAEEDKVDEDDGRGGHDFGELVEADGVEGQREVAEDDVAGEETADGQHLPDVEAHSFESAKGAQGGEEEDEAGCGEVPHDDHELAGFELGVAECSFAQEDQAQR